MSAFKCFMTIDIVKLVSGVLLSECSVTAKKIKVEASMVLVCASTNGQFHRDGSTNHATNSVICRPIKVQFFKLTYTSLRAYLRHSVD